MKANIPTILIEHFVYSWLIGLQFIFLFGLILMIAIHHLVVREMFANFWLLHQPLNRFLIIIILNFPIILPTNPLNSSNPHLLFRKGLRPRILTEPELSLIFLRWTFRCNSFANLT